jgi:hypothetical protein
VTVRVYVRTTSNTLCHIHVYAPICPTRSCRAFVASAAVNAMLVLVTVAIPVGRSQDLRTFLRTLAAAAGAGAIVTVTTVQAALPPRSCPARAHCEGRTAGPHSPRSARGYRPACANNVSMYHRCRASELPKGANRAVDTLPHAHDADTVNPLRTTHAHANPPTYHRELKVSSLSLQKALLVAVCRQTGCANKGQPSGHATSGQVLSPCDEFALIQALSARPATPQTATNEHLWVAHIGHAHARAKREAVASLETPTAAPATQNRVT